MLNYAKRKIVIKLGIKVITEVIKDFFDSILLHIFIVLKSLKKKKKERKGAK